MPDSLDVGRILQEVGGLKAQQSRADEDRRDMKLAVDKLTETGEKTLGEIRKLDGKVDLIAQKQTAQALNLDEAKAALYGHGDEPGVVERMRSVFGVVFGDDKEDGMLKTLERLNERDIKRNAIVGFFAAVGSAIVVIATALAVPWDKIAKLFGH